jgi:drug/metabolite transporter (DMT)-like permease
MGSRFANMPAWFWKLALAVSAAIWGASFVVVKGALDDVPPCWMLVPRFGFTALILIVVFRRTLMEHLDRDHMLYGSILGIFSALGFVTQSIGLADTTPGRSAFLTAVYCILVPFLNWAVARRKPKGMHVVAAVLAILGIGLISLGEGFSLAFSFGDGLSLVDAVFYALHIVFVARFSEGRDIMTLTIVQIVASIPIALVFALVLEQPPVLGAISPSFWISLGYLVIFSSCIGMVVQNVAQSIVEPATAALLLSLESVFAVFFSVIFFNEPLTARILLGFSLIFVAVVVSEVLPSLLERGERRQ